MPLSPRYEEKRAVGGMQAGQVFTAMWCISYL